MVSNPSTSLIEAEVPSPCVGICRLDGQGYCVGCRRSLDEIAEWPRASLARRREIVRELALRTLIIS